MATAATSQFGACDASASQKCDRADAMVVLRRLRDAGYSAYLAGGCVRDLLLGLAPKDWDVATDAPPTRVRAMFSNTQAVGAAFGVILVRYGGSQIEVATFRADAEYADGRRPNAVRFTTAQEDARRRDFTINGLFLDPLRDGPLDGQVIDYVGGRADLAGRVVRAIGDADARFREDHLRLLRAVRFAARFDFTIEPATADAIARHAPQLVRISPERIAEELRTMLTPPTRGTAYALLEEFGLLPLVFRFLDRPKIEKTTNRAGLLFMALSSAESIPFGLALAAASLDYCVAQPATGESFQSLFDAKHVQKVVRALRQSLKISNEESDLLAETLLGLAPLLDDEPPSVARLKRFLAGPASPLSRQLLEAMRTVGLLEESFVRSLQARLSRLDETDVAPPPLVSGDDLAGAGLTPGPLFKRVLDAVYDAQLEDRVATKPQAMELAMRLAREPASGAG